MLKILVADDHPVIREGLKRVIAGTRDMAVVAEASDGQDVLEKVPRFHPDILLLDLSMPGRSGLEILKQLKTQFPRLRVLVLSQHPEDHYAVRTLQAGASGYLTKESASDELITALRKVAGGGTYVSAGLAEKLALDLGTDTKKPPHKKLSDREFEILVMFGAGWTVSEMAEELSLSVKTISTYRTRLLEKMNMTKNAELIRYAIEHRLAGSEPPSRTAPV